MFTLRSWKRSAEVAGVPGGESVAATTGVTSNLAGRAGTLVAHPHSLNLYWLNRGGETSEAARAVLTLRRAHQGQHPMQGRTWAQGGQGWGRSRHPRQGLSDGSAQPGQGPPSAASTGPSFLANWGGAAAIGTGVTSGHRHRVHAPELGRVSSSGRSRCA